MSKTTAQNITSTGLTLREACALLVERVRELSAVRRERDIWQFMALHGLQRSTELQRQIDMIDERSYIHRTRSQDERDVFLDQCDLRRQDVAA